MTDNASVNTSQNKPAPTLSTSLGKGAAMAMVVGAVIGSGIFAKPAANAMASSSVPLILVGWVVGGFITLMGGICMAELALMMPQSAASPVLSRPHARTRAPLRATVALGRRQQHRGDGAAGALLFPLVEVDLKGPAVPRLHLRRR